MLTRSGKSVPFEGMRIRIATDSLEEADFQRIPSGQSVEVTFDAAEAHDLSAGGKFGFLADGAFSFAEEHGTKLVGSVPYVSETLESDVDGVQAAAVKVAYKDRRTYVQSDCSGQKLTVTRNALSSCASIAKKSQQAAQSGAAAKMQEYFKSSSQSTRNTVAGVFSRVANECGSTNGGYADYYCSDVYGGCSDRVLAYTIPSYSVMVYCSLYFNQLPALTRTCHAQDQANTNIHESTHLTQVKGTEDYGGYGYDFVRSLSAAQNLNHADTYAQFANAIYLGC